MIKIKKNGLDDETMDVNTTISASSMRASRPASLASSSNRQSLACKLANIDKDESI